MLFLNTFREYTQGKGRKADDYRGETTTDPRQAEYIVYCLD